jgi:hypothetical protein
MPGDSPDVQHKVEYKAKVRKYKPGDVLVVNVSATQVQAKTFHLNDKDTTFEIAPSVRKKSTVEITEWKNEQGHRTVSVVPHD